MSYELSPERKLDGDLEEISKLIDQRALLRESLWRVKQYRVMYQSPAKEQGVLNDYSLTVAARAKISELIEQDVKQQIEVLEKSLAQKGICV